MVLAGPDAMLAHVVDPPRPAAVEAGVASLVGVGALEAVEGPREAG